MKEGFQVGKHAYFVQKGGGISGSSIDSL